MWGEGIVQNVVNKKHVKEYGLTKKSGIFDI